MNAAPTKVGPHGGKYHIGKSGKKVYGESKGVAKTKPVPKDDGDTSGHDEVELLGGNAKKSKELLLGFRQNVFHDKGIEFKGAVGKAFGVPAQNDAGRISRLMQEHERKKGGLVRDQKKSSAEGSVDVVGRRLAAGEAHVSTVAAMAKVSQGHYLEDRVTVFRGITGKQAEEIIAAKKSGQPVNIKTDTTSSFTESHGIASQFATHGPSRKVRSAHAVVIKVTVPRSSIVASHRAFKELAKEMEVVIASHGGHSIDPNDIQVL